MTQINFQEIINKNNNYDYIEIQGTNQLTKTYKVIHKPSTQKYFYKQIQNKSKDEFELITTIIKTLNKNNFNTPKLIFFNYNNETKICHQLFEYLNNDKETKNPKQNKENYIQILNLIKQFNQIIKKILKIEIKQLNLENIKIQNKINQKKLNLSQNLKTQFQTELNYDYSSQEIILNDINSSNFLIHKNKYYLIDFDDIKFGTFEYDLSKIYVNLYYENTDTLTSFKAFSKLINNNIQKINYKTLINAIILNLLDKIYIGLLQTKKQNKLISNRLIEIKTNKEKYLKILINEK